jgi:beta-D-xylosidase 4
MSAALGLQILLVALAGQASAQSAADRAARYFPDCISGPLRNNTICDTTADPLTRATALVRAMTLEEKFANTDQNQPGAPRLGLPPYIWWNEALHGIAEQNGVQFEEEGEWSHATSFPQPILTGAAFDDELVHQIATVISTEFRAFGNNLKSGLQAWTPNINPFRDPRWGRGQETPGEDPFHLSSYVKNLIDGLQGGEDLEIKRMGATCKHFAGYDLESWNGNHRHQFDAQIGSRDLVEYYMPPFQQCARDSNAFSFMCTYNELNGRPTCADPWLLNDVLREHWDWTDEQQTVVSDCGAIQNIYYPHRYNDTREKVVAEALTAGTDYDCGTYYSTYLPGAYEQGLIQESDLDLSLVRQYASLVRLGYFNGPNSTYRSLGWENVNTEEAQQLALRAAEEGIVLLKNDGLLPMQIGSNMSIAVVGDWANATEQMQGNYYGVAPYLHGPAYAANQTGANVTIVNQPGGGKNNPTTDNLKPLWTAAEANDVIIYLGGIDNDVEAEDKDRHDIAWSGNQIDIIERLAEYGKPMIVVQMGTMLDDSPIVNNPNISALLWAGYPGQDGGVAIFNIIQGLTAPAGRLPVTQYPARYVGEVPMTDMTLRPNETTGHPGRTYMWYEGEPIFEFGHGLHYTNFSVSFDSDSAPASYGSNSSNSSAAATYSIQDLTGNCGERYPDLCPFETLDVTVENTGSVSSDYVVLGYLTGQFGPQPYPKKQLKAYARVHDVAAGSSARASLELKLGSLGRVADNGDMTLFPGDYALVIDNDAKASLNFTLTGEPVILDHWPQPPPVNEKTETYWVGGYPGTGVKNQTSWAQQPLQ